MSLIKNKERGFTLIELLVVVAIIGVLSSVVLSSLSSARAKARDARRMSDIKQIQNAIELYISDHGNPPDLGGINSFASEPMSAEWTQLETQLAPYIKNLPRDPCGVSCWQKAGSISDGFFSYQYQTPAFTGTGNYGIWAENLEAKTGFFKLGTILDS